MQVLKLQQLNIFNSIKQISFKAMRFSAQILNLHENTLWNFERKFFTNRKYFVDLNSQCEKLTKCKILRVNS